MEYQVHNINWNDEKVKRFWNFYNNYKPFEELWFSKTVGREVILFSSKYVNVGGNVLDYGIGKGHLSRYLMENKNINLFACDFSDDTVSNINQQFHSLSNFKGCSLVKDFPSGFEEDQFDNVFLIEAIEHLTDDFLLPTLAEIRRILKPGGSVIITTPNDENLDLQNVICPDCGCVFHRVQHVRSFNKGNLSRIMELNGFRESFCGAIDFTDYGPRRMLKMTKNSLRKFFGITHKQPHMVFIGKK